MLLMMINSKIPAKNAIVFKVNSIFNKKKEQKKIQIESNYLATQTNKKILVIILNYVLCIMSF